VVGFFTSGHLAVIAIYCSMADGLYVMESKVEHPEQETMSVIASMNPNAVRISMIPSPSYQRDLRWLLLLSLLEVSVLVHLPMP
jgi:hypothetical protein